MEHRERPAPPPMPTADQVPASLRGLRRWCGWKAAWDDNKKKWRKPPYSPVDGSAIGATEEYAPHLLDFDAAREGAVRHGLDGVGFVFVEDEGLVGVDFDDCRRDGAIHPAVLAWLRWFPSYAEVSPSGAGVHVIIRARKLAKPVSATPLPGGDGATVEAYSQKRYFTFTGQRHGDAVDAADAQAGLDKLLDSLGQKGGEEGEEGRSRAMSAASARRIHRDNLASLRNAPEGRGNETLNSVAFFAARAFLAGALEGTEQKVKADILRVVTEEWARPHPEEGARATIESGWRSGAEEGPLEIREADWPDVERAVEEFNQKYFCVKDYGGRFRVCHLKPYRIFKKGTSVALVAQSEYDFGAGFRNEKIEAGAKANGEPLLKTRSNAWLDSPNRRTYDEVVFEPGTEVPSNLLNLWRGFAVEPRRGDCSLYLAHARENVCGGDEEKYRYLIGWMAYAVRNPGEQGHAAVVVQGEKGVGKNVFAEGFADLFGQHGMVVSDQQRLTKNFNAHLRDKCVLIADEAFFAGDRRHESTLKSLITGPTITIEAKGVDPVTCPNYLHIMILGNDRWLVPATGDERRFLMLHCGAARRRDNRYFTAIVNQLRDGGHAALLWHLLHEVSLKSFDVRNVPHTRELRGQMSESLRGAEAAWLECLYNGLAPGRLQRDGTLLVKTADFIDWAAGAKKQWWSSIRPQHISALLGTGERGMGFDRGRGLEKDDRARWWRVPPLAEARRRWDEARFAEEWPEDGGKWDAIEGEGF